MTNRLMEVKNTIQLVNTSLDNIMKEKKKKAFNIGNLKKHFHNNTHITFMKIKQRMTPTDNPQYRANILPNSMELPNVVNVNNPAESMLKEILLIWNGQV